ncbi:DNA-processing protein DprA [Streptomyces mirabilis]|uniref:DNA-processing protein DprA n=1 Tax=Streptomyces mirabilis TaxID=68239 RepID=UPI0036BF7333
MPQLTASAIAVTGNRNATKQAITRAQAFAAAVTEVGHTVTATLAYGVDTAAHRAAAQAGRATLAVLPRGLNRAHRTPTPSCWAPSPRPAVRWSASTGPAPRSAARRSGPAPSCSPRSCAR